jgi:large subunit ribosomal protein L14
MTFYIGTRIKVIDNSGVSYGKCVCIYRRNFDKSVSVGKLIMITIKKCKRKKDIRRGMLYKAVVVRSNNPFFFLGGHFIRCDSNGIVLLKPNGDLVASRVVGRLVSHRLRSFGFSKILSISRYVC